MKILLFINNLLLSPFIFIGRKFREAYSFDRYYKKVCKLRKLNGLEKRSRKDVKKIYDELRGDL